MPSNPPYDDDWSGESRNLETGEVRHPADYHAFTPDGKEPLHCAVCWQYEAWFLHRRAL